MCVVCLCVCVCACAFACVCICARARVVIKWLRVRCNIARALKDALGLSWLRLGMEAVCENAGGVRW